MAFGSVFNHGIGQVLHAERAEAEDVALTEHAREDRPAAGLDCVHDAPGDAEAAGPVVEVEAQKVHGRRQELRRGGTAYLRQCVRRVGWEPRGGRHVWRSHRRHDEGDTDEQAVSERKHGVAPQRKRRRLLRAEELRKELVLPPGC